MSGAGRFAQSRTAPHHGGMSIWSALTGRAPTAVTGADALPGRAQPSFSPPATNLVLNTPLLGPWPEGTEVLYVAMGCFWGAERRLWRTPGVIGTAVGYMGGFTPFPTYEEVCTGRTGHTETVMVAYDPTVVSTREVLAVFWESHDPTQGMRQGNDIGTQYRSAIFPTTSDQAEVIAETVRTYGAALAADGCGAITTEVAPADDFEFYPAEAYHQQYLHTHPHGYDCHSSTGVRLPSL